MKIDVIFLNVCINLFCLAIVQTIFFFYYVKDIIADATLLPLKEVADDFNHCSLYIPRKNQAYNEFYKEMLQSIDDTDISKAREQRIKKNKRLLERMIQINVIIFVILIALSSFCFYRKSINVKEYLTSIGFVLGGFSTEFLFFLTVASKHKYVTGIELMALIFENLAKYKMN